MSRFHVAPALCLAATLLAAGAAHATPADVPVARGLIVTLKAPADGSREAPQAARERLKTVAADAGLPTAAPLPVGRDAHVLPFEQPLAGSALADAERRVRLNPLVAHVEPDLRLKRQAEPNDPYYANGTQWHLRRPADGGPAALNLRRPGRAAPAAPTRWWRCSTPARCSTTPTWPASGCPASI